MSMSTCFACYIHPSPLDTKKVVPYHPQQLPRRGKRCYPVEIARSAPQRYGWLRAILFDGRYKEYRPYLS